MKKKIVVISVLGSVTVLSAGALLAFGLTHKNIPASGDPEVNSYEIRFDHDSIVAGSYRKEEEGYYTVFKLKEDFKVNGETYSIETVDYDPNAYTGTFAYGLDEITLTNDYLLTISNQRYKSAYYYFDIIDRATIDFNESKMVYNLGNSTYDTSYFEESNNSAFEPAQGYKRIFVCIESVHYSDIVNIEYIKLVFSCVK